MSTNDTSMSTNERPTPETDAFRDARLQLMDEWRKDFEAALDFARRLEQQRDELRAEVERLKEENNDRREECGRLKCERDDLKADKARLDWRTPGAVYVPTLAAGSQDHV